MVKKRSQKDTPDISLEEVMEQLPGHIYWKTKNGILLGCSKKTWEDFKLASLNEYIGKTDYDLLPKAQADKLTQIDKEVINTGKPIVTEEESDICDGTTALYLTHKAPLRAKDGSIVGISGVSLNVTKARREELQRFHLLESVIALTPGHVYWKDKNGKYLGCNNEQAKSLGLSSRNEIINKVPYERLSSEAASLLKAGDNEVLQYGRTITLEESGIREDGTTGFFLTKKTPLYDECGNVDGLVGISVDITDRKAAEALRAKQALMEAAAQVSHDIRSPLAALNTVLRNLPTIPEDQRILIRNAVRRINDIANNLLVDYRGETPEPKTSDNDQQPPATQKTELLSSLLDTLLSEKKAQMGDRRVELNLDIEVEAFGLFATIDSTQFKRVISNLLNNAIEAIKGTGDVTVRLEKQADFARIRLIDTGKGMPPAVLTKIKTGGITHGKTGGTGIGIASAIGLVEQGGGHFDMTSQVGQGTTVIIDLPTAPAPDWFQEALMLEPDSTVVILDDDESIHGIWTSRCQPFLAEITLRHIHHSKTFREYCAAADLSQSLFLVDYELLGSDETGLDLVEGLALSDRAILVTSRYEEAKVRAQAKKLGVKIIPKNFSPYIAIQLVQTAQAQAPSQEQPQLVFIDDDNTLTRAWEQAAEFTGVCIKTFNRTADLRDALATLAKSTPIYIDSNLGESISGELFAKELYERGFTELYLASGYPKGYFGDLPWIKDVVGKAPPF